MGMRLTAGGYIEADPLTEKRHCADCDEWLRCPGCCGWGWCMEAQDFTDADDGCESEVA